MIQSSGRLRGALIGCGFFAANHLNAWNAIEDVEMVAVCDRDAAKAEAAARRFGIPRFHADAEAMLAAERPDFVDIVTTLPSHRALVELAARHGVPAICQKPFAADLEDAEAMVRACTQAGVPLMVHENFRWQRPLLAAKEALDQGRIGRPFFGRLMFRHGFDIIANQPYLAQEERFAIMDVGLHLLDVARFLFGEAGRIYCRTARIDERLRGEDTATMLLDHANGVTSVVELSTATRTEPEPFPETLLHIEGTEGTLDLLQGYRLVVSRPGRREEREVDAPVLPWAEHPWHVIQDSVLAIQRHWVDCLREGREPDTSGADNLKTLQLTFGAYHSAETGAAEVFA
jgi:D-apiose dehydrogenase